MIPYISPDHTTLFGAIHLFGVLVAIGILVGANRVRVRGAQLGLDELACSSLSTWIVVCAFIMGHVFDVVAYQPDELARRVFWPGFGALHLHFPIASFSPLRLTSPLTEDVPSQLGLLLNIAGGLSSFGGFIGAFLGMLYWSRRERVRLLVCSDSLLFGLSYGWFFGRLGCFTAHDHPGAFTSFFLSVDYPEGARHDLGLDEALIAGLLAAAFTYFIRKPRPIGFYTAIACSFYGPVRLGLDFLRVRDVAGADPRYFGLTPAQYGSLAVMVLGLVIAARVVRRSNGGTVASGSDQSAGSTTGGSNTSANSDGQKVRA